MFPRRVDELGLTSIVSSEGAENASELSATGVGVDGALPIGTRSGIDALGVQGNQIRRYIHSFDDA